MIVWLLAIGAFISLIVFMYLEQNISKYISALAILLSAFLAALSVLKSIQNSKQSENNTALSKKKINLIYIDFVLLDIYRQIDFIKNEISHLNTRYESLTKKTAPHKIQETQCKYVEKEVNNIVNIASEYFIDTLNDRNIQLVKRRVTLEDKEILYSLDEGQRICLFEICGHLLTSEQLFSHVKNSKDGKILSKYVNSLDTLFEQLIYWITILKDDIQKEFPDFRVQSIEEYNNLHSKKSTES